MFSNWGRFIFRHRRPVLGLMTILLLAGGVLGLGLPGQLSQSGYDDPNSQSTKAAEIADEAFGRDHTSDVIVLYTAPDGLTVDDPAFATKVEDSLNNVQQEYPDQIGAITSYWGTNLAALATKDKQHAFASVQLTGTTDTATLDQFHEIKGSFKLPGVKVEVSGLQPIGDAIGVGMDQDTQRAELIALPLVALLLFFVFGGVVAALLPVIVGVLTIAGATGAMWLLSHFMAINTFAQPVVTLIGLGLAIDYGLFIVSRYREEIAEGYSVEAAVRRSVATAGRTVVFSATMLVVSFSGLLMFPQGFLQSVALGGLFAIAIAAITSLTVLPAILGLLGRRVDALSLPFLNRTKTNAQIESGFWGRLTGWVSKHPAWVAVPIIIVMLLLIVPFKNIAFGGLSEKYLPPDNPTRVAQEHFDELFPTFRTNPVNVVVTGANDQQLGQIYQAANEVPGFTGPFVPKPTENGVNMLTAGLVNPDRPGDTINELRSIPTPDGVEVLVGGVPALTQDTIDTLGDRLPWMILYIVVVTTVLMFLAFGSLVLPIKAVLMSALGLGSTLGILTWIFIDGHGASLLNFTPGPLMAAVLVLLLAIIFGLSTDYEVFLISRMVEAREKGASTQESIRVGTAHTGRIITAAALILIVVTGAFGFSEIVMMKYIAYGMISALILDATVIRMLLVPSIMTLLGDDCWWAPKWMQRLQHRIGLGEMQLPPEDPAHPPRPVHASAGAPAAAVAGAGAATAGVAGGGAGRSRTSPGGTSAIPRITTDETPAYAADRAAQDSEDDASRQAQQRRAAEQRRQEEHRRAAEERRRADEQHKAELRRKTEARQAEERQRAENRRQSEERRAEERRNAEKARQAQLRREAEDRRSAEQQYAAERQRAAVEQRRAQQRADRKRQEQQRRETDRPAETSRHAGKESGADDHTDRAQPRYPWEERPTAPRRAGTSGSSDAEDTPSSHHTPSRRVDTPDEEDTGGRHIRPDNGEQVTVEELLRRHRESRGE
ncbi:MAG: MMPL family transporter [Tomitella sp.]|nr:MMPL family transporter [Tomitella sp.]